jgi:DNA-binding NarL/FixJ family response regulator
MVSVDADDAASNLPEDCAGIVASACAAGAAAGLCAPADGENIQEAIEAAIRRQARRENDFMAEDLP